MLHDTQPRSSTWRAVLTGLVCLDLTLNTGNYRRSLAFPGEPSTHIQTVIFYSRRGPRHRANQGAREVTAMVAAMIKPADNSWPEGYVISETTANSDMWKIKIMGQKTGSDSRGKYPRGPDP